ncbi:uncharacterized protein ACNS7B_009495 [Menidia menidia]
MYGAMEQLRRHYRSERFSELGDCTASRGCGGGHAPPGTGHAPPPGGHAPPPGGHAPPPGGHAPPGGAQRRPPPSKLHAHAEVDAVIQEVDIVGLDGHIYKGRLNAPPLRSTETKLPTISSRDGSGRTKERARGSAPQRPAPSPEAGLSTPAPLSPRSASSGSGRDWSALGCPSQGATPPSEDPEAPPTP